jgi:FKBP-type peptidyl-prolyl cis-trans isomerase FklB
MKKLFFIISATLVLVSCSDSDESSTPISFKTQKDKLSYILGAINAKTITNSNEKSLEQLDKDEMIKGFNENLTDKEADGCLESIQKLFGPNYQDFNKKYIKEGSLCMGRMTGYAFYADIKKLGALDKVNLAMVKRGYADGLYKRDTTIKEQAMRQMMNEFIVKLNEANGSKMMANAKKLPGSKVYPNGIVIKTVKDGNGPLISMQNDVKVHYTLTSALGDTMESSRMPNQQGKIEPLPVSVGGGIIEGWSFALQNMKKGGIYKVFIPWKLAYGEEQGRQSLCFDMEIMEIGKSGAFVQAQMPPNGNIR